MPALNKSLQNIQQRDENSREEIMSLDERSLSFHDCRRNASNSSDNFTLQTCSPRKVTFKQPPSSSSCSSDIHYEKLVRGTARDNDWTKSTLSQLSESKYWTILVYLAFAFIAAMLITAIIFLSLFATSNIIYKPISLTNTNQFHIYLCLLIKII
jgi:hypothetical protein